MTHVSLIKGQDRRENIIKSLTLISDEIKEGLRKRQIVIKPNLVVSNKALAVSHVDQIRGILDFFKEFYTQKIIIAEASYHDTNTAYKNFGYYKLFDDYNLELRDLNKEPFKNLTIEDRTGRNISIRVSSLLLDRDNYLISAARLKTHDTVVVTLSLKNILMGCIEVSDKKLMHQGIKQINKNLAALSSYLWPDLAVIDGLEAMEGDGPTQGTAAHVGVAISSADPLAADTVACALMGVDLSKIGYLTYISEKGAGEPDIKKIKISGNSLSKCIKPLKLHKTVKDQYKWKE